ncbi:MAG: hypothetical protein Q7R54_01805 [bacterium]|nr:hypothetical protein [bacterium]
MIQAHGPGGSFTDVQLRRVVEGLRNHNTIHAIARGLQAVALDPTKKKKVSTTTLFSVLNSYGTIYEMLIYFGVPEEEARTLEAYYKPAQDSIENRREKRRLPLPFRLASRHSTAATE